MDEIPPTVDEIALGHMDAFIEVCKKEKAEQQQLREVQHRCFWSRRLDFVEAVAKMTLIVAILITGPPEKLQVEALLLDLQKSPLLMRNYKNFVGAILSDVQSNDSFESKMPGIAQAMEDLLELVTADRKANDKTEDLMEYEHTKSIQGLSRTIARAKFDRQRAAADILVAFRTAVEGQCASAGADELLRAVFLAASPHGNNSDSDL